MSWLVVWNILIFWYIGNNHPNWHTHIFQRGWNHQPVSECTAHLEFPGETTKLFGIYHVFGQTKTMDSPASTISRPKKLRQLQFSTPKTPKQPDRSSACLPQFPENLQFWARNQVLASLYNLTLHDGFFCPGRILINPIFIGGLHIHCKESHDPWIPWPQAASESESLAGWANTLATSHCAPVSARHRTDGREVGAGEKLNWSYIRLGWQLLLKIVIIFNVREYT